MERTPAALSVLVVDDHEDGAVSLAVMLRLYGYRATVARSGPAAIAVAAVDPPDVILLDIKMPGMDGWEAAGRLRVPTAGAGTRPMLIALTGCGTAADHERAAALGFDMLLTKPVEPAVLVGILDGVRRVVVSPACRTHARVAVRAETTA